MFSVASLLGWLYLQHISQLLISIGIWKKENKGHPDVENGSSQKPHDWEKLLCITLSRLWMHIAHRTARLGINKYCSEGSHIIWLVVLTILKNMSSSMGRMTSHILWKIENVWNHQPDIFDIPTTGLRGTSTGKPQCGVKVVPRSDVCWFMLRCKLVRY